MGMKAAEILKTCDKEGVRFLRLQFTDILGINKNVEVPRCQFEKALDGEIMFDGSSIEGFVRIEESDMLLMPDLDTFRIFPWSHTNGKVARLICDVITPDGEPFAGCPRQTLKRQMEKAKELGFSHDDRPRGGVLPLPRDAGRRPDRRHARLRRLLRPRRRSTRARRSAATSSSPSRRWASRSRRRTTRSPPASTRSTSSTATRSPRPTTSRPSSSSSRRSPWTTASTRRSCRSRSSGVNGSGMHIHQSLLTGTPRAKNAFFDPKAPYQLSKIAMYYIGGMLQHAKAIARGHEPARQLLQAARAGLRGAGQRRLVRAQPLAAGPHPRAARHGHALRGPDARSGVQPLPGASRSCSRPASTASRTRSRPASR